MPFPPNHRSSQQLLKTSTLKRDEEKKIKKGERERGKASEGEKSEVPVVAAVVLVCLPADKPQGSQGAFEARTREEEEGINAEKTLREGEERRKKK